MAEILTWLWDYSVATIPAIILLSIVFIKMNPKLFLGLFKYEALVDDFSHTAGPRISDKHLSRLEKVTQKQSVVSGAKLKTEKLLSSIYNQQSIHINGFNRALLIAFVYPIALLVISWFFSSEPLLMGQAEILPDISWWRKLPLLLFPLYVFYVVKYLPEQLRRYVKNDNIIVLAQLLAFAFGAGAGAGAVAVAVAGAGAIAGAVIYDLLIEKYYVKYHVLAIVLLGLLGLLYLSMPMWLGMIAEVEENAFAGNETSFVMVFFFVTLPIINALSDWLSVSFTQFCLSRYTKQNARWYFWLLMDLIAALVMLTLVFYGVFQTLKLAEYWGWQVDATQIFTNFKEAPFAADNRWIILLVLTNLVPTLLHLLLIVTGHATGWFFGQQVNMQQLLDKVKLAASLTPQEKSEKSVVDYTWSKEEATQVAEYVAKMPYIWSAFVLSFIIPLGHGCYWVVTELLQSMVGLI